MDLHEYGTACATPKWLGWVTILAWLLVWMWVS